RGIGLEAISDKLVHRYGGGYCYEHALLFAAVAERLGYRVTRLLSRARPHRSGARTHMTLRVVPSVGPDAVPYLVDVGFGAGRLVVMRLDDGISRRLVDDELTVEHADGRSERIPVPLERLERVLRELDVQLDRGELAELRARLARCQP